MSTPAGGVFPQFRHAWAPGGIIAPQCMQYRFFSRKLSVIVMLLSPCELAVSGAVPLSVADIKTVSESLPFGMVTVGFSSLPFGMEICI